MASERLSDRDLARLDVPGIGDDVRMMARELIERRTEDAAKFDATIVVMPSFDDKPRRVFLSANDVEALDWARDVVADRIKERRAIGGLTIHSDRALAVLDKLRAKEEPR